jgi:hypothetical protein
MSLKNVRTEHATFSIRREDVMLDAIFIDPLGNSKASTISYNPLGKDTK